MHQAEGRAPLAAGHTADLLFGEDSLWPRSALEAQVSQDAVNVL